MKSIIELLQWLVGGIVAYAKKKTNKAVDCRTDSDVVDNAIRKGREMLERERAE